MAEYRALLDTLNSAILGSRSSALTDRPTPKSDTPAGSPPASTTQGSRSLARRSKSRSSDPPAKRRRVQPRSRSRDSSATRSDTQLLSLNPSAPSAKPSKSTTSAPSSNSSSQSPSTASGTTSGSGESAESGSSLDDLTRSVLSQSRSTARRRPGSDVRSATLDPSPVAQAASTDPVTTVFDQGLSHSLSPGAPEPRYLSYSSTPIAVVPVIDI